MSSTYRHRSTRPSRDTHEPAAPPISEISPPCPRCGHTGFVHSDGADRRCLYAECACALPVDQRRPNEVVSLTARRDGARVTATLRRGEAEEHAELLRRLGWETELGREA